MEDEVVDTTSEDVELLNESDEPEVTEEVPDVSERKEESPLETEEGEEEETEKGVTEEDEEEDTEVKDILPHERPSIGDLKKEYPDLFKKFPTLRDMYFREREFSEIYTTIEEAKQAAEQSTVLDNLREKVTSGDAESLFGAIKEVDETALDRISENILPTLFKMNPALHWKAASPLMQNIVQSFYREGVKNGNENIKNSALYLSNYLFEDIEVATGKKSVVEQRKDDSISDERKKFEEEKKQFETQHFTGFLNSVTSSAETGLSELILERGAKNRLKIDPDGVFSEFIRDSIKAKIIQQVREQMDADKAHLKYMNSLWDKAKKSGYTDEWKSSILSAYLARAKSLVPTIRARLVSEASGTASASNGNKEKIVEKTISRRNLEDSGKGSKEAPKVIDARKVDWSRTSDEDLLSDRVTYKKAN